MHLIEITIYIITGISNLFINEKSAKFNSDEKKILTYSLLKINKKFFNIKLN